jgi:hypothetical protein
MKHHNNTTLIAASLIGTDDKFNIPSDKEDWGATNVARDVFALLNDSGNVLVVSTFDLEPYNSQTEYKIEHKSGLIDRMCWYGMLEYCMDRKLFISQNRTTSGGFQDLEITIPAKIVEAAALAERIESGFEQTPESLSSWMCKIFEDYLEVNAYDIRKNREVSLLDVLQNKKVVVKSLNRQEAKDIIASKLEELLKL